MSRGRIATALTLTVLVISSHSGKADVRADQKTRVELGGVLGKMVNIFGGKAAREGVTSTVIVKGDRKATLNEATGQIIDLSEEKIYDLDMKRKTYEVTTFAELRRRMEEAQKKAEEDARHEQTKEKSTAPPENQKEVEVDFDVKDTGQKKTVNGFDTREVVMTITVREKGKTLEQNGGVVLTSDMWMAPTIAAMKEITDFDLRYAQKLYGTMIAGISAEQMGAALAMYPAMKQGIAKMNAEGGKVDGTAVLTTTTFEAVKSAEQAAEEAKAAKGDEDDKSGASGGISGVLGGFARRVAKKKVESDPKPRVTFMTGTNEVLKVTTEVGATDVAIPVGFQRK